MSYRYTSSSIDLKPVIYYAAPQEEEQPDINMIWAIVDMYRQGILLAREKCLESEALALSRLGVIYHKVRYPIWGKGEGGEGVAIQHRCR